MRFWDSSAIVPLLVYESDSRRMLALFRADPHMVVWWASVVECSAALARREREAAMDGAGAVRALARLERLQRRWDEVQPVVAVRTLARRLLRVHPLRTADSLQLAAALTLAGGEPAGLEFVSLDRRLADAAAREGLPVVGPLAT